MRLWLKQSRIDLQPRLEVLFGENGLAGGHPTDERQPDLLPDGVLELDPPRGAGHERDDALAGQGPQMLLGGVGGAEAQLVRDFGARRRHTSIGDEALDEAQDLRLARGEIGHFACLFIYTATVIISRSASAARGGSVPAPAGHDVPRMRGRSHASRLLVSAATSHAQATSYANRAIKNQPLRHRRKHARV